MELNEVKDAISEGVKPVMTAWEEYKAANDARLAEIEKKGSADVLFGDKLAKIDTTLDRYEGLNQKLTLTEQKNKALEEKLAEFETLMARLPGLSKKSGADGDEWKTRANDWLRAAVNCINYGMPNLSQDQRKSIEDVVSEYKSLNVSADVQGGYLVPIEYVREIIKGVTEMSPVRSVVRVRSTSNKAIQLPKRIGQFAAQWVAEQGTRTETQGLAYGMDEIPTHEMFALIDITNQMLEDSAYNMESEIRMEAEEQFALAEGIAALNGDGVGKPFGILASPAVLETNSGSGTAITADGMIDLFYAVKTAYSRNGAFGMNRGTVAAVRKLKDTTNQYLWQPGFANAVPNTILGAPYVEMPDMPAIAANSNPVVFGDWRRGYTLVERLAMEFLRDPYTQATSGNVRYIFRRRLGGQVVLGEALRKLRIST
jgi:HK97 family phage major capsid protein